MKSVKRHVISVTLVVLVVTGLVVGTFLAGLRPKLGLDLRGGLSVTLTAPEGTKPELLEKTVETLRGRIDRAGVAEPEISREGSNNVFIQLPGTEDPKRLLRLVGRTAQLQMRQVLEVIPKESPKYASSKVAEVDDPSKELILRDAHSATKYRLSKAELTGDAVRKGTARPDTETGAAAWQVLLDFKSDGAKKWQEVTGRLACLQGEQREIAIVLDGRVESHPQVAPDVKCNEGITGGNTSITGSFDEKEAKDLALVLTAGALPVKLEQSEVRTVSPTLGNDSLRAGLMAGALGLALVMLYVLIYYRTLGLQTWVGLLVFSAAIYGLIVGFGALIGWNLTLAGIAGLIVSIGIATDSYIVFFERVKEEIHGGRTLPSSIDKGFGHAWRTMRTANTVTILAAVVLYFLAVGPVRGFALALGMATILDLGITYWLTWPLAALLARNKFFADNKVLGMRRALEGGKAEGSLLRKIYRSDFHIDFIGRRKLWFAISIVLVGISVLALVPGIRGLSYGIDFKGGTIYRGPAAGSITVPEVRPPLEAAGLKEPLVQIVREPGSNRSEIQVQTESTLKPEEREKVVTALAKVTGARESEINTESVGEKWGAQITTKALRGLVVFLLLAILYMSWRLEPKMAAAGIIALVHDLIITAGIYALVGFEVTPATVIATLTILGYSLYDTVVVFDKIRENQSLASNARKSFAHIANDSTNQVLMRSINTSLTVLLPVGSLLVVGSAVVGADTLKDLALALFVGIAASTFSSIFTATPVLSVWKQREARYAGVRDRVLQEARLPRTGAGASGGGPAVSPSNDGVAARRVAGKEPAGNDDRQEVPAMAAARPPRNAGAESSGGPAPGTNGGVARQQRRKQSRAKRKKTGRR